MFSRDNLSNLFNILRSSRAFIAAVLAALFSYSVLAILDNLSLITAHLFPPNFGFLTSIIPPLVLQYPGSVETSALAVTTTTALMIGVNIGLLAEMLSFEGLTATPGALLGLTVSGCAACTTGVISIAGASIGVSFLPFEGLELGLLGIAMLGFSALYISEKDRQRYCEI